VIVGNDPTGREAGRQVVQAASVEARAEGVTLGLRRREAEARCAGAVVLDADEGGEARAFEDVARAMDPITPEVVMERPGVLTFRTRGPSRYFGGDDALGARALDAVRGAGVPDARVGVADGAFAARLAAHSARATGVHVVEASGSPAFVARWPVVVLDAALELAGDFVSLLVRLGLSTLGDLAALPAGAVLARFGTVGVRAHRLARGLDVHGAPPAPPPPDLAEVCELDPPAQRVDEVAFAVKGLADRLLQRLDTLGLACPQVLVEAETEHGERLTRRWRHDGALTSATLVTRVRWQLDGWLIREARHEVEATTGGITMVRLAPDQVVPATGRQLGLWGGDAAGHDRAERALVRLQGMLGPEAVVTATVRGGRAPSERVGWVPWGEPREARESRAPAPWPGAVPGPAPARVHAPPLAAELVDGDGALLAVSGRGVGSGTPAHLRCGALPGGGGPVIAWAGPWLHDSRWWDRATRRRRALWQVVVATDGGAETACLVAVEGGRAAIEAVYD
jgi:protein ImuB